MCEICGYIDEQKQEPCEAEDEYIIDIVYHRQKCKKCDRLIDMNTHQYPTNDYICSVCGYRHEHDYYVLNFDDKYHIKRCSLCNFASSEPHTTPGVCKCGYSS